MKKVIIPVAVAALLMSGCAISGNSQSSDILDFIGSESSGTSHISGIPDNESSSVEDQTAQPSNVTVIKWGVGGFSHEEESLDKLNERLAAEERNMRVELVELDMDTEMTFSKLVEDYEKENGSLDIVTYGSDWIYKIGAVNTFFESGYFRELSTEDMAAFTDIPDICWDAAKVNGKHYSVPALSFGFGENTGLYYHFNTKYISEDKLRDFNGTAAELEDILSGIVPNEDLTALEYRTDYLNFTDYTPASAKGGLYLSDKTMTAVNPYEVEEVIEYVRTLNGLYKKGYMNYDIDFSGWGSGEWLNTDFAVSVCAGRISEEELDKRLGKNRRVTVYSKPYYMENRLIDSTGIPVNSAHPDEAMELLKRLHSDKELSGLLSESERDAMGLPRDNEPVDVGEIKLSHFAGFQLRYTDIDDFKEVSELCQSSFDKLCKADDFDKTLAEINAELKAAGIDDYVERVNQRLEESNAASNQ